MRANSLNRSNSAMSAREQRDRLSQLRVGYEKCRLAAIADYLETGSDEPTLSDMTGYIVAIGFFRKYYRVVLDNGCECQLYNQRYAPHIGDYVIEGELCIE